MRNLLSANFSRLLKSKVFWGLEGGVAAWSVFMYYMFVYNTNNQGENWMIDNAHVYFFYFLLYIGAVMAVFTALYLGTEYDHGTIRNKLAAGHKRSQVYLANLILVTAMGIVFMLTHMLAAVLVGIPTVGADVVAEVHSPLWRVPCSVLIIVCYGALFTLLAMLDSSKARCAVVSLVLALAILFGGMWVYGVVTMEETKVQMVLQEDGSYERQEVPNPRYLTGTERVIYEWVDDCLPGSQALHIADRDGEFNPRMPLCMLALSGALTLGGVTVFKRKDIK